MAKEITFELNKETNSVEIHGSPAGLKYLSKVLLELSEETKSDVHLMSPSWGGEELSNDKHGLENSLIHHVKIFCWSD